MIGVTLTGADAAAYSVEDPFVRIKISVVPVQARALALNLKETYENLRHQMVSEGLPLLSATELESEIAERKGTRS